MLVRHINLLFFRYIPIVLLLALGTAAAQDRQPANFDVEDSEKALDNRIVFPKIKKDGSAMIDCFAIVETSGKMKDYGCYAQDQIDAPFAEAVNYAAKKARVNPAIIDGKKRQIYLQFRAEFIAEGDERTIDLYLNPGFAENIEAYGYDHIAGQRVVGKEAWLGVCPQAARYSLWVRAYLGEDGRTDNVNLIHSGGIVPTEACQNAIKETILSSLYTPAMADGAPVPSTYVEMFGN
jgi:hypothetical protein